MHDNTTHNTMSKIYVNYQWYERNYPNINLYKSINPNQTYLLTFFFYIDTHITQFLISKIIFLKKLKTVEMSAHCI